MYLEFEFESVSRLEMVTMRNLQNLFICNLLLIFCQFLFFQNTSLDVGIVFQNIIFSKKILNRDQTIIL